MIDARRGVLLAASLSALLLSPGQESAAAGSGDVVFRNACYDGGAGQVHILIARPAGIERADFGGNHTGAFISAALVPNARVAEITGFTTGAREVGAPVLAGHARALLNEWDGRAE